MAKQIGSMAAVCWLSALACACGATAPVSLEQRPIRSKRALGGTDTSQYNFEGSIQGWVTDDQPANQTNNNSLTVVTPTNPGPIYSGSGSLQLNVNVVGTVAEAVAEAYTADVLSPQPGPNQWITFNIWVPPNTQTQVQAVKPFIKYNTPTTTFAYTDFYISSSSGLPSDGWVQVYLQVPSNSVAVTDLGVEVQCFSNTTWAGAVYVDSISW